MSKEVSRIAPTSLREQLRDAAQQGQRDEYGGDRIEDTAVNAAMQAFRMASNVKMLQSHRSPPSEFEDMPLPEPEVEPPELPFEPPALPEPAEESFGFSSTSRTGNSYIQEWLYAPPQQESVPQPDISRTFGTVQPEQSFGDSLSGGTGRELYSQNQQVSTVQKGLETVPQTAEIRTIVPASAERTVDTPQRQPKTKELSTPHDISRTNTLKQPELSVRLKSDEKQTQQIKTCEMYVKKQSGVFLQQNAKVSAVPRSDTSGTHIPEQAVRMQQHQIKTREMYAKKHSSDSVKLNTG